MGTSPGPSHTVRFGAFEADLRAGELHKRGRKIKIQEQPFQLLAALLERPGEIVTREELRQRLWATEIFVDFDRSLSVAASKLRDALGDSADNPRFVETVPKHGYRFIAPVERLHEKTPRRRSLWRRRLPWLVAAAVVVAIGVGVWRYGFPPTGRHLPPVPLTSLAGPQSHPAISPDGTMVAFSWSGRPEGDALAFPVDIYVQEVRGEGPVRLTDNPAIEFSPTWSPDGSRIAFCRQLPGSPTAGFTIHVVDTWSGGERRLGQSAAGNEFYMPPRLAWSPGGEFLALVDKGSPHEPESIFLLSIRSGQKRKLTSPPAQFGRDVAPAFSPDGRTLAFIRMRTKDFGPCDIYLQPLAADGTPTGEPRRLISEEWMIFGLDWTADGEGIVFSAAGPGISHTLWRMPVSGGEPQRLNVGDNADFPAVSHEGDRLVYVRSVHDVNIWRTVGPTSTDPAFTGTGDSPERLIHSTRMDTNPKYSPDGKKIAFVSGRTGVGEIYMCDSDGSNQRRLTSFGESRRTFRGGRFGGSGSPHWSPDGRLVAFQSGMEGNTDIYVVSAREATAPRRLTRQVSRDMCPSWSKDGKWIYFGSNRGGDWQIWRMPSEGGAAEQVTKTGGIEAYESADGRFVYYAKEWPTRGIWKVPVAGGEETKVLDDGTQARWESLKDGICFVGRAPTGGCAVNFFRFTTGEVEHVTEVPEGERMHHGFAVSPDGRWILYPQVDKYDSDLMLVENFR